VPDQRIKKGEGNKTTCYFFSGYEEEYNNGNLSKTTKYYFVNGQRVAERSSTDGLRYYHTDHLGSSVRITDATGTLQLSIGYLPYGGTAYTIGTGSIEYQLTGKEKDTTGLYYYGSRYYDPELARFIQPDTTLGGGLNRLDFF
jgi:RHS repeat-associated protein